MAYARTRRAVSPGRARRWLTALLGASIAAAVVLNPAYSSLAYQSVDDSGFLLEAAATARLTRASDLVIFEGYDWDPAIPYYSRRRGHMIGPDPDSRTTAAELATEGYRLLVTRRLDSGIAADAMRSGRWTGVLGRRVYITGDTFADLRGAPIGATDDLDVAGTTLLEQPVTIRCGKGGVAFPRADGITVLWLADGTPRGAKLSVMPGYGDVPVRRAIVVGPGEGPLRVECRGAEEVTVLAVDSRPPDSL